MDVETRLNRLEGKVAILETHMDTLSKNLDSLRTETGQYLDSIDKKLDQLDYLKTIVELLREKRN